MKSRKQIIADTPSHYKDIVQKGFRPGVPITSSELTEAIRSLPCPTYKALADYFGMHPINMAKKLRRESDLYQCYIKEIRPYVPYEAKKIQAVRGWVIIPEEILLAAILHTAGKGGASALAPIIQDLMGLQVPPPVWVVQQHIRHYDSAERAMGDARQRLLDKAEDNLAAALEKEATSTDGKIPTTLWVLEKMPEWTKTRRVDIDVSGTVEHKQNTVDIDQLSLERRKELLEAIENASVEENTIDAEYEIEEFDAG